MRHMKKVGLALALALTSAGAAYAAGFLTNGLPSAGGSQYPSTVPLTGNETIPADTNLPSGQNPASESVTTNQMASFFSGLPDSNNFIIGGDAGTNLFQRGTTGAGVTTTVTYGGPDRWAYWSGTGTSMTVSKTTTASDVPTGYTAAFKMNRTNGQTGLVQMCMAQEIESAMAKAFQGSTAELDFQAYTGATFSGTNTGMTAYIVYGTGTDEGMQKLAWGLNAGGGGSTGWTGQTNATAAVISLGAVSTAGRYVAVANIPTTATELGVVLCYTPASATNAAATDYVAFAGIQLRRNNALAAYANATAGYAATSLPASSFNRRDYATEQVLQQRYYYQITDNASTVYSVGICSMSTTSIANCLVQFPVTMRVAPTMTYATGFEASATTASASATACTGLTTTATLTGNTASTQNVIIDCASSAGFGAAGTSGFLWTLGAATTGSIKASAEF